MNNLSPTGKWTILVIVIVVAIAAIWLYGGSGSGTQNPASTGIGSGTTVTDNGSMPGGTATPMASPTGTTAGTKSGGSTGAGSQTGASNGGGTVPKSTIMLVTPTPGDIWIADTQNPVQWSRAAGVTGQIDLLSASTLQLVGVILPQVGPAQTSYTWNTRDLLQSRTSPNKFTVTPGSYVIRISFDGNNLSPVTSQPFTITANSSTPPYNPY
jgi:hypothetical protein